MASTQRARAALPQRLWIRALRPQALAHQLSDHLETTDKIVARCLIGWWSNDFHQCARLTTTEATTG